MIIILCLQGFLVYERLEERRRLTDVDYMIQSVFNKQITGDAFIDVAITVKGAEDTDA